MNNQNTQNLKRSNIKYIIFLIIVSCIEISAIYIIYSNKEYYKTRINDLNTYLKNGDVEKVNGTVKELGYSNNKEVQKIVEDTNFMINQSKSVDYSKKTLIEMSDEDFKLLNDGKLSNKYIAVNYLNNDFLKSLQQNKGNRELWIAENQKLEEEKQIKLAKQAENEKTKAENERIQIEKKKKDKSISAVTLTRQCKINELQYKRKNFVVCGVVEKVVEILDLPYVYIRGSVGSSVLCSFEPSDRRNLENLKSDQIVYIRGTCDGIGAVLKNGDMKKINETMKELGFSNYVMMVDCSLLTGNEWVNSKDILTFGEHNTR